VALLPTLSVDLRAASNVGFINGENLHFPFMTPTLFVSPEISGETFLMNAFFGSKLHTRIPH